jgi:hypothetical protein
VFFSHKNATDAEEEDGFSQARVDIICIGDRPDEQEKWIGEFIGANSLAIGQCRTKWDHIFKINKNIIYYKRKLNKK